ncbi:hypothetical protein GCM10009760_30840 [Kitasatospora kazusensis]|uniref:Secreted protein n=1 Tax=Kitasatospora kazusensis TaxID=407974 RepID=A0ABN2ZLA9_9ACTN
MRNGLVQLGAWAAATGAAVLLSWLGVHAVLSDASSGEPRTLRLPAPLPSASPPTPAAPATATGSPGPPPSAPAGPAASPTRTASRKPAPTGATSVHSYLVTGGRVALDMKPDEADLVSAAPDPGWQMQVWHGDQWMRLDFSQGDSTNSVFVTWNGHPPQVQTVVR